MKKLVLLMVLMVFFACSDGFATRVITKPTLGYEFSGKVVEVKEVPGFRRSQIIWWAIEVEGKEGKKVEVRVAPVWLYHNMEIKKGDEVTVKAYIPPYWLIRGFNALMACRIKDKNADIVYDFTKVRRLCRRIGFSKGVFPEFTGIYKGTSVIKNGEIKGEITSITKRPGLRIKREWWVLKVKTKEGVYTFYVAPVFRLPTLDLKTGTRVLVKFYTPPRWRVLNLKNTYMACFIKDTSTGVEITLRRCY